MATEYDFLLLETGSYLLLEDGGKIIIAEREVADDAGGGASGWSSTSSGHGWPWPQKLINVILPHRVMIDDEDVLFIIE